MQGVGVIGIGLEDMAVDTLSLGQSSSLVVGKGLLDGF